MKALSVIFLIAGAVITYSSKKIAFRLLYGKREPNDADNVYVKLVGFALILIAAIITFF